MPTMGHRSPVITLDGLSELEEERCQYITNALYDLGSYCADLNAAIVLFHRSSGWMAALSPFEPTIRSERELLIRWRFIACRDAAITIFNFDESLEAIGSNFNKCSTLRGLIDPKAKRLATRTFAKNFPSFKGMRHSAAHPGKLFGTPEEFSQHVPNTGITIINSLIGNKFTTSFEGRTISLEMGPEILAKLIEVRDLYWAVFRAVDPSPF